MFFGAANVTGKMAVDEMSVLYSQGLRNITFGFILVSFALKSEVITEVKTLFRERSPALTLIMINQGCNAKNLVMNHTFLYTELAKLCVLFHN